jgi:sugar phosphate isomerase/epimerase
VHVDIAENETRTPPGTHQQDVTAYLRALKRIDYQGPVVMECRWEHVGRQAGAALQYLSEAIQRVWRTP